MKGSLTILKTSFHLSIFRSVQDGVIYSCSVINVWLWSCSATAVSKGGAYEGRGGRAAAAVIETRQRAHSVGCRLVQLALRRSSCRRRENCSRSLQLSTPQVASCDLLPSCQPGEGGYSLARPPAPPQVGNIENPPSQSHSLGTVSRCQGLESFPVWFS